MKTLLLMRHAKSSWSDLLLLDHDRPLNARGCQAAPRMGRLIEEHDLIPDAIFCSTSVRTRQTCELLLREWPGSPRIQFLPELYHCPAERLWSIAGQFPEDAQRVLVLGHNPGLADFLAAAVGYTKKFPTAGVAWLTVPVEQWSELTSDTPLTLQNLWRPRDVE